MTASTPPRRSTRPVRRPAAIDPPPLASLLTTDQVAARLQVDVETVRRMLNRGELPGYRVGRTLRVAPADLAAYLASRRVVDEALADVEDQLAVVELAPPSSRTRPSAAAPTTRRRTG